MNNLHRELAPISDAAWAQIENETTRTIKRYLAGRRVVDVPAPGGVALPGVATGHLMAITSPGEGIIAHQREVKALVEVRVPFELSRQAIDDVERGSEDSDWQPAKDAAKILAFAEDRTIFDGYRAANIQGIREGTSNPIKSLPDDVRDYPDAVAQAVTQLRLVGVNGPYSVLLGADEYTELAETRDQGHPVLEHVKHIIDGHIIWAPAIDGAFVLSTRGGDFELNIGLDVSIGYLSHTDTAVRLYLQETLTFRVLTSEASSFFRHTEEVTRQRERMNRRTGRKGLVDQPNLQEDDHIMKKMPNMKLAVSFFLSGAIVLSAMVTMAMAAGNKHVAEALEHAKEAVSHGKQGHADALAKHADAALKHAGMAKKDLKDDSNLDEAIARLEDALLQAGQENVKKGTEAAEMAVIQLAEVK